MSILWRWCALSLYEAPEFKTLYETDDETTEKSNKNNDDIKDTTSNNHVEEAKHNVEADDVYEDHIGDEVSQLQNAKISLETMWAKHTYVDAYFSNIFSNRIDNHANKFLVIHFSTFGKNCKRQNNVE